jgi:hypothetical protein
MIRRNAQRTVLESTDLFRNKGQAGHEGRRKDFT